MARTVIALLVLSGVSLLSEARAAQNVFVGNTIRASYVVTGRSCTKFGCKDLRQEFKDFVYVDAGGKLGELIQNGTRQSFTIVGYSSAFDSQAHALVPGEGVKIFNSWSMDNNKLIRKDEIHSANLVNPNGQILMQRTIYLIAGNKCSVGWKYDPVPGFSFQNSVELQACEILQGHVEH